MRLARSLAKCANDLDNYGLYSAADSIDGILLRLAGGAQPTADKNKTPENFKKARGALADKLSVVGSYTLIDALKNDELLLESNLKEVVRISEFGPSERLENLIGHTLKQLGDFIHQQTENKKQSMDEKQEEECIKTNRVIGRLLIDLGDQC